MKWQCPECDKYNPPALETCSCGTDKPVQHKTTGAPKRHGECAFDGCHKPGELSNGLRGDMPFYCPEHFKPRSKGGKEFKQTSAIAEKALKELRERK